MNTIAKISELEREWACANIDVETFITKRQAERVKSLTSLTIGKNVIASTYFAVNDYYYKKHVLYADNNNNNNNNSSLPSFMNCFSAIECLKRYGAKFNNGAPRHLFHDIETKRRIAKRFMCLEPNLQPEWLTWRKNATNMPSESTKLMEKSECKETAVPVCCNDHDVYELSNKEIFEMSEFQLNTWWKGAPLLPSPIVLFIIDGIGDNTYLELGNRTPLEVVAGVTPRRAETTTSTTTTSTTTTTTTMINVCEPKESMTLPEVQSTLNINAFLERVASEKKFIAHTAINNNNGNEKRTENAPHSKMCVDICKLASMFYEEGINTITRYGVSGQMDPYMAGMSCGSDTAHLSMFGYPPLLYYRGRGAYEALGAGLVLDDEDVAFKSNFATLEEFDKVDCDGNSSNNNIIIGNNCNNNSNSNSSNSKGNYENDIQENLYKEPITSTRVLHRRCDRDFTKEGPILCHDLNNTLVECDLDGVAFDYPHRIKIQYATEHRCGVAISGAWNRTEHTAHNSTSCLYSNTLTKEEGECSNTVVGMLSDKITGTDPLKDNRALLTCVPTVSKEHPEYAAAVYTSRLVNAASAKLTKLLSIHPINVTRRKYNKQGIAIEEMRSEVENAYINGDVEEVDHIHTTPVERAINNIENTTITGMLKVDANMKQNATSNVNENNNDVISTTTTNDINSDNNNSVELHNSASLKDQSQNSTKELHNSSNQQEEEKEESTIQSNKNEIVLCKKNVANVILFRGAAKKGWVPSFTVRHGLIGFIIAPTCIIKGLGVCCGLASEIQSNYRRKSYEQNSNLLKREADIIKAGENECNEYDVQVREHNFSQRELKGGKEHDERLEETLDCMNGATGDVHSNLMVKVFAALQAIYGKSHVTFKKEKENCSAYKIDIINAANESPKRETEDVRSILCKDNVYNFVVIHVKGVDDAGHDQSLYDKLNMLKKCGKAIKTLWDELPYGSTMGVVADHSTPLYIGDHCCEPVPVSIAKKHYSSTDNFHNKNMKTKFDYPHEFNKNIMRNTSGVLHDKVQHYSEIETRRGALGRFRGEHLVDVLKKLHYHYHYE